MTRRSKTKVRQSRAREQAVSRLTTGNLKQVCWNNGFRTVTDLSLRIGRSRTAIYGAVRDPEAYPKTTTDLDAVLTNRD